MSTYKTELRVTVTPEMESAVRAFCKREGVTISDLLRQSLAAALGSPQRPLRKCGCVKALKDLKSLPKVSHNCVAYGTVNLCIEVLEKGT